MDIKMMKIDELIPYVNNPRKNDGEAVDKVASSIKNFGFKVPIIIDKQNEIIAGHTRHKAAKKLNLVEVPVIVADDLSDQQIKAFRIADNKVSEYSEWDWDLLNVEIEGIELFTGFNDEELENFEVEERKDLSENFKEEYQIIIDCENEKELEKIYNKLEKENINCRISTY